VVATDGHESGVVCIAELPSPGGHGFEHLGGVIWLDGCIPRVGQREGFANVDVMRDRVAFEVLGGVSDGAGAEAGAGAVGDAGVVGHAIDGPVDGCVFGCDIFEPRISAEGGDAGETGGDARVWEDGFGHCVDGRGSEREDWSGGIGGRDKKAPRASGGPCRAPGGKQGRT
jgi:hypothetical protein